jgi:hypothetical protein
MCEGIIVLLEQARASRERARRAERLAGDIPTRDVARALLAYAEQLERLAVEAEERAFALVETLAKTQALRADIMALVDGIRAMRDCKRPSKPLR